MINETFRMNGKDFSACAYHYGPAEPSTEIKGLPDSYTLDGTLHDDVFAIKGTHIYPINPVTEAERRAIEAEYKASNVYLTYYDKSTGTDKTVLCKPTPVTWRKVQIDPVMYQPTDLIFVER